MNEALDAIKQAIEAIDPWLPNDSKIEQTHTILRQLPNDYDYKVYRYGTKHYVCIIPPMVTWTTRHEDMFGCNMFGYNPNM